MFFSVDILCRRDAKFGLIWLAALHADKLKKREYLQVDVEKTCEELMRYLPRGSPEIRPGRMRKLFSLYLASMLMYGTVIVYKKQTDYLFADVKRMVHDFKSLMAVPISIDMINPIGRNIDMQDPLETINPQFLANFGRVDRPLTQSPVLMSFDEDDYIRVRTPRSDRTPSEFSRRGGRGGGGGGGAGGFLHLARHEDITMQEDNFFGFGSPFPEEDLPPADIEIPTVRTGVSTIDVIIDDLLRDPESSIDDRSTPRNGGNGGGGDDGGGGGNGGGYHGDDYGMNMDVGPPFTDAPITSASPADETNYNQQPMDDDGPPAPRRPRGMPPAEPDVTMPPPTAIPPRRRQANREPPIAFALASLSQEEIDGASPRPRAGARYRGVRGIDQNCIISGDDMNRQINDLESNQRAERVIDLQRLRRQNENLFATPALNLASSRLRGFFDGNLITRPVPGTFDDIFHSPPWTIPHEASSLGSPFPIRDEHEEDQMPPLVMPMDDDFPMPPPPPSPPGPPGVRATSASEMSSAEEIRRKTEERYRGTDESFDRPTIDHQEGTTGDMGGGPGAGGNIGDDQPLSQPPDEFPSHHPQRSPTPINHLERCYPGLADVPTAPPQVVPLSADQLRDHINEMTADYNSTTFEELCPPGTTTKAQAAKTFYKLLELYKAGMPINLEQEEHFGPITISRRY